LEKSIENLPAVLSDSMTIAASSTNRDALESHNRIDTNKPNLDRDKVTETLVESMSLELFVGDDAKVDRDFCMTSFDNKKDDHNGKANDNVDKEALHHAAWCGDLAAVQYLLEKGEANIEAKDGAGKTALHCATLCGELAVVQYLLEKGGANIEATHGHGVTSLHSAVQCCNLVVVKYLLERSGANIEATSDNGSTALKIAVE
jgi:hypothetical protein